MNIILFSFVLMMSGIGVSTVPSEESEQKVFGPVCPTAKDLYNAGISFLQGDFLDEVAPLKKAVHFLIQSSNHGHVSSMSKLSDIFLGQAIRSLNDPLDPCHTNGLSFLGRAIYFSNWAASLGGAEEKYQYYSLIQAIRTQSIDYLDGQNDVKAYMFLKDAVTLGHSLAIYHFAIGYGYKGNELMAINHLTVLKRKFEKLKVSSVTYEKSRFFIEPKFLQDHIDCLRKRLLEKLMSDKPK